MSDTSLIPTALNGPYPLLWYSSNTPHKQGQTHCDYARWLGQHAGPHGTGYRLRSTAVPLATGIAHHRGLELIGGWILEHEQKFPGALYQLPVEVAAWAADEAASAYEATARARGLQLTALDATNAAAIEQLIMEQRTLVEALVWIWALVRLPGLLPEYTIFAVEDEECIVMDCTCGLGEQIADHDLHAANGCAGIAYQDKPDMIWRRRNDPNSYAYIQAKSWGSINASKEMKWEHDAQLLFGMEAASRRYGINVTEAFVDISLKGWRGRDRGKPVTEPKYQHTYLAYGYHNPVIGLQDVMSDTAAAIGAWAAEDSWHDGTRPRKLSGDYAKVPIWEPERPLPVVREGASRVENWVRGVLTPLQQAKQLTVLGPFPRPVNRVAKAVAGIKAEERRFRADVEYLREHGAIFPDHPLVEEVISRSWECTHYDGTPCFGRRVCWDDMHPETSGKFERRRPHHVPELEAVLALGHDLPESDEHEGEGDAE